MSGPVKRVLYFCTDPHCDVPAVYRVDWYDRQGFSTVCEAHYQILEQHFPSVSARSRALLDGEGLPGVGWDPVTMQVVRSRGFTWKRWVGARRKESPDG